MLIREAKGANQSDALILGTGKTISDYNGASDDAVDSRFEDVRSTLGGRAGRLRKLNWSHLMDLDAYTAGRCKTQQTLVLSYSERNSRKGHGISREKEREKGTHGSGSFLCDLDWS